MTICQRFEPSNKADLNVYDQTQQAPLGSLLVFEGASMTN